MPKRKATAIDTARVTAYARDINYDVCRRIALDLIVAFGHVGD